MLNEKSKNIVLLSIPFQRLIRSHLSSILIRPLRDVADVVVVTPFGDNSAFLAELNKLGLEKVLIQPPGSSTFVSRTLFNVVANMRLRGFWFKHRKKIPYYWAIRHLKAAPDVRPKRFGGFYKIALDVLAIVGQFEKLWIFFDSFVGRWTYNCKELEAITKSYRNVVLVQASSWGYQDAALAWYARKRKWGSILIPYTTDQLYCNGFLFLKYDYVCVQGSAEFFWAKNLFKIPERRIKKIGSTYLKVISEMIESTKANASATRKRLLYAGLSSAYFPFDVELKLVSALSRHLSEFYGVNWEIVYRPVVQSEYELEKVKRSLDGLANVVIEFPSATAIGLSTYTETNKDRDLQNLITTLRSVEVLITSLTTSLSIEAALLNVPTIAFYPEDDEMLIKRFTHLQLDSDGYFPGLVGVPVAMNEKQLFATINRLVKDDKARDEVSMCLLRQWDFPRQVNDSMLRSTIHSLFKRHAD